MISVARIVGGDRPACAHGQSGRASVVVGIRLPVARHQDQRCLVPSHATNVRLELASADVIHSFWVDGMKDAVDIFPVRRAHLIWSSSHPASSTEIAIPVVAATLSACDFACWRAVPAISISGQRASVCFPRSSSRRTRLTPACALNTGHAAPLGHNLHESHLQRLLDGDESTGKSPSH